MADLMKLVISVVGFALLAVGGLGGVQNLKAGTLDQSQNIMAVLATMFSGAVLLHNRDALTALFERLRPATKTPASKSAAAVSGFVQIVKPLDHHAQPVASLFGGIAEKVSDATGRFLSTQTELRDNEAIYHLASRAEKITDVEQRKAVLALLRNVNDELFVMHHDMEGSKSNAPKSAPKTA